MYSFQRYPRYKTKNVEFQAALQIKKHVCDVIRWIRHQAKFPGMEQSGYGRLDAEFLPILISNLKTFFFSSSPNVNTIYGSSETHPDGHNPDHMILLWTVPWLEKKKWNMNVTANILHLQEEEFVIIYVWCFWRATSKTSCFLTECQHNKRLWCTESAIVKGNAAKDKENLFT